MAITTETLEEADFRYGRSFLFFHSESTLAGMATDSIVIGVGRFPIKLSEISIESDSELLSWKAYGGSLYTEGTGTVIQEIKRNPSAATKSDTNIQINPTIGAVGQEFFPNPIELVAQIAAGNRAYINENLLSTDFGLLANTNYLIEINNPDAGPVRYDLNIDVRIKRMDG